MLLVRHRVEQRANACSVIVKAEVSRREDRSSFAPALEQVRQDANHVACFLRIGGYQHLVFEQLQQVRRVGPGLDELLAFAVLLGGRHVEQAEILRNVFGD